MSRFGYQSIKGFTLIEILVSTVILAIGLLGLAAMQTIALKDNQDAYFFTQASSLAYEMSDRIKVNPVPWRGTALPTNTACAAFTLTCDAVGSACSADDMATFDFCAWASNVKNRITSDATANVAPSGTSGICNGGSSRRCISINWASNHQLTTNTAVNNSFQMEVTP
jgi:type IV pilus assembly protein PilV